MRVIVRTESAGANWASLDTTPPRFHNAAQAFLGKSILATGHDFKQQVHLFAAHHQNLVSILFEFLYETPVFTAKEGLTADFTLSAEATLEEASALPQFLAAVEMHQGLGNKGDSRDAFYANTLGHFLPFARSLQLFDPFLLCNIVDDRKQTGIQWLLNQRLCKLPLKVELHTLLPRDRDDCGGSRSWTEESIIEKAIHFLNGLSGCKQEFAVSIHVHERGLGRHDRFARIKFEQNSLCLEMSKGSEIFSHPTLAEAYKIHSLTQAEFLAKRASWPELSEALYSLHKSSSTS